MKRRCILCDKTKKATSFGLRIISGTKKYRYKDVCEECESPGGAVHFREKRNQRQLQSSPMGSDTPVSR
jgi:hypothetical protein